jgi:Flp pilus assembly pilin Flp
MDILQFGRHEIGQGLVEYAVLAAMMSIAAVAVIIGINHMLPTLFNGVVNSL